MSFEELLDVQWSVTHQIVWNFIHEFIHLLSKILHVDINSKVSAFVALVSGRFA